MSVAATTPGTVAARGPAAALATLAERALRDRLKLPLYAGTGLALLAVFGIAIFSSVDDTDFFSNLPAAFDSLIGGSAGGNYVVSEVFGLIAPIVVLVVAISGGVNAVAGEERDHTAGLLLAQPVQRRDLVIAKAAALVVHLVLTVALFLAGFLIGSALFGSGIASADAIAAAVHLLALGLAFAMVALALSCWTGSATLSLGIAAALAILADLVASMLPLIKGVEGAAKASPWYYYNGSQPLVHGINALHLCVLLAIAAVGFALARYGIEHRDIDSGTRSRALSIAGLDRFARPRVRGIFTKSVTERSLIISVAGGDLALLAVVVSLMFDGLQTTLHDLSTNIPDSLAGLFGSVDLGTPVGWINGELLSIVAPAVVIAVAVVVGVGAIAGEQKNHTLDLLLAAPVTRRRVVAEKAAALVVIVVTIDAVIALGILAGSALAGLGLGTANVLAALTHVTLLALFFGALALAVGAVASAPTATRVTSVAALAAYLVQSLFPSAEALKPYTTLSPWHYYNSSNPLANGFDIPHLLVLAALTAVAFAGALNLVDRREVTA